MSVMEEVPNDKNWTEFEVLAGERDQIEFLILGAEKYKTKTALAKMSQGSSSNMKKMMASY